jgi:parvulin-like peptidyl-prolyl isomerase
VDEISQPVRTYFGWHLIKLIEKIENEGEATQYHTAHILIAGVNFDDWLADQISNAKIRWFIYPAEE